MNTQNTLSLTDLVGQLKDTTFDEKNNTFDELENFIFEDSSIGLEDIHNEAEVLINKAKEARENKGLFKIMPANKWIEQAKARPIPNMLFGELWHEGELCILFADTNLGKSILAVQIANAISTGEPIRAFPMTAKAQKVIYFDFELSDKQLEKRYSIEYDNHYIFDDNMLRAEIRQEDVPDGQTYEEYIYRSLERSIEETDAKILIIDNITYLKQATEKAKDALPLMKELKALKSKYNLSILCLAHTPKRDLSKPITRNDLQGSKMLINFCDSCFAIGESTTDKALRYIKQIKARATEIVYDTENVCVCEIWKPSNFLEFNFIGYGSEREHLKQVGEDENQAERVRDLSLQGRSLREIGAELGISHMKASRLLSKL